MGDKTKEFKEKKVDQALTKFLFDSAEADKDQVELPADLKQCVENLSKLRSNELAAETLDVYSTADLIELQRELANNKYYLGRQLSVLKGAQSYAYVYRKFMTASDWNPTRERLGGQLERRPTIGDIENDLEERLVNIRKSEVAFQMICDRLEVLLQWINDTLLLLQNRIRMNDTDQKTQRYDENSTKK